MAPSTIRKAIGVVKDQASIRIAKASHNIASDLEVLVVRATSHDEYPASEMHIREIMDLTSFSHSYINSCIASVSKRLSKTRDWMVAIKALMLLHRLLVDGHPGFKEEIVYTSCRGVRLLNMSDFMDEAHVNSWDYSSFVRFYSMYLDEKVEFLVYERRQRDGGNGSLEERGAYDHKLTRTSRQYNEATESAERDVMPIKELGPERALFRLNQLLRTLDRTLACRPNGAAKTSRLVLIALYWVLKESFTLYGEVCETLEVLLNRFTEMDHVNCANAFDAYLQAAKLINELTGLYGWCKDVGIAISSEFPVVQRITDEVLGHLEGLLKEKNRDGPNSKSPEGNREERPSALVKVESEQNMNEVNVLPPPDNYTSSPPPIEPRTGPQPQLISQELIDLSDVGVSADKQANDLAMALFSDVRSTVTNGSSEAIPSNVAHEVTSAWQTSAADGTQADWELILVETASDLAKQRSDMAVGLDPLLLNGMYDQGTLRQHMSPAQAGGRSASGPALQAMSKTETLVQALPAPDGILKQVEPKNPFSASVTLPPPAYVQMGDIERKRHLPVQEQHIWDMYDGEGMQGLAGLGQMSGSPGYYGSVPQQMMPHGLPRDGSYHAS